MVLGVQVEVVVLVLPVQPAPPEILELVVQMVLTAVVRQPEIQAQQEIQVILVVLVETD